jgi:hypothetical protein
VVERERRVSADRQDMIQTLKKLKDGDKPTEELLRVCLAIWPVLGSFAETH